MRRYHPQIKICGLTDPDEAEASARAGADAIGLVFYPPSPRHVTLDQAARIAGRLPDHVTAVGVFVNPGLDEVSHAVSRCGLKAIQLHGVESPEFVVNIIRENGDLKVVKALFAAKSPGLQEAPRYDVAGYLVECGKGRLPGGNALQWNWALAKPMGRQYPLILAGGLSPDTVAEAISAGLPDAVDASSGLEASPGHKDLEKVHAFIEAVQQAHVAYIGHERMIREIF